DRSYSPRGLNFQPRPNPPAYVDQRFNGQPNWNTFKETNDQLLMPPPPALSANVQAPPSMRVRPFTSYPSNEQYSNREHPLGYYMRPENSGYRFDARPPPNV